MSFPPKNKNESGMVAVSGDEMIFLLLSQLNQGRNISFEKTSF